MVVLVVVVRTWVIPAVIVGQIRKSYGGEATIESWWLGGGSAGVRGLALHEGADTDSPVWLRAESVRTDLSLGAILRGRVTPKSVAIRHPAVTFRLDRDGGPLTRLPLKPSSGETGPLPRIAIEDAEVTVLREGRDESFVARGIDAKLAPETDKLVVSASTDDPNWGRWNARGQFDTASKTGAIRLHVAALNANAERISRLVFVPDEVWDHVVPNGPVEVTVEATLDANRESPLSLVTTIDLREHDRRSADPRP